MSYSCATLTMWVWRVIISALLLVLCNLVTGEKKFGGRACTFPAVYNFGDSNSDTGGRSAAFKPIGYPYGVPFFHKPSGRASDGRLLIDFIAQKLELPYLSAYLNSIGSNFSHGANFASGGSTIRRQNETIFQYDISPFSLDIQLTQFEQFKSRTSDRYIEGKKLSDWKNLPRPEDFAKALYTFDIGQHDLSVGFRKMTTDQLLATLPDIIDQLDDAVQRVYNQGGRSFWIHNIGPYGCLPVHRYRNPNPAPGALDPYGCVIEKNNMSLKFNSLLMERVVKLRDELPHAAITYVDVYAAKYALISNATNEGFKDPLSVCCGYHVKDSHVWCGRIGKINATFVYGAACPDPSRYIYWDGIHYSDAGNLWVANLLLNGSFSDPPVPITRACNKAVTN